MTIFGPKPWANPFGKISIFRLFKLLVFFNLQRLFFVLQYRKRHFPGHYCLKKKSLKNAHFWTKTMGKIEKLSIFRLFELLVFLGQKRVFSFQNIIKQIFLAYIAEKKVGKMAIFGPKPWVNSFGKMSIFRLFELLVFIAQKGFFSFQNIVKDIFLAQIASNKKVVKMAFFWTKTMG